MQGVRRVWLLPCVLAPLGLLVPWAVAPSRIPGATAVGGYAFFRHWLTKYPTLGPVSHEVLLGMLCVVGLAIVPVVFVLALLRGRPPRGLAIALALVQLVLFVPVLIRLDAALFVAGLSSLEPLLMTGPVLHAASVTAMIASVAIYAARRSPRNERR